MDEVLYHVCKDVLVHFSYNHPMLSNVRSREHVSVSAETLEVIGRFSQGATEKQWTAALSICRGKDSTRYNFGEKGLQEDPSFIMTDSDLSKELKGSALFDLFLKKHVLIKNETEYLSFFEPRKLYFDSSKMGNFHEKVGEYLLANRIVNKWEWWHNQKFSKDGKRIENSFYKNIQEKFIKNYFSELTLKGQKILDFGCGNGYFSNLIAQCGGNVLGIDTSEDLINIAKNNWKGKKTDFIYCKNNAETISVLTNKHAQFDLIFVQDVFSILLDHSLLKKGLPNDVEIILEKLLGTLKPNGLLICMDPNPIYWQAVRFGAKNFPIAVSTEYRNKIFNTTPNNYEVVNILSKYGLGLTYWAHPQSSKDSQDGIYNNCFAIWDFMVYRKFS